MKYIAMKVNKQVFYINTDEFRQEKQNKGKQSKLHMGTHSRLNL